jgi:lipopolysaccharide transport system ATP-binding protein
MSKTALRVEGLGKRYRLGGLQTYQTLRDSVVDLLRGRRAEQKKKPDFWALRDVSFELKEGEVLGIVGRNGAGKSTMLKLLSHITTPDTGRIEVHGRVGSLLEVGTGFHPELTGRENIFMNGILLGMKRREVEHKFDEIVAFSGVEEFLDTPVKRYSSGMRVRLGFAVAAHLDPEILLVDEVLAVGDAQFQAKCLGRMNDVANEGRTVVFVSHQLESVMTLCSRALWLENGTLKRDGSPADIVAEYLSQTRSTIAGQSLSARKDRRGEGDVQIHAMEIRNDSGHAVTMIPVGAKMSLMLRFVGRGQYNNTDMKIKIAIRDRLGRMVARLANDYVGRVFDIIPRSGNIIVDIPKMPLTPGVYSIDFIMRLNGVVMDQVREAFYFEVTPGDYFGGGRVAQTTEAVVFLDQHWDIEAIG